ncbi:hypothetical protein EPK99_09465 [Neorhizobium lilium]|uniref:Transmembrane protein n=1 Tax=Neorhizobium lilium TaxID=2503024 RepID=A0A444LIE3_9HYPH|nr:DUF6105 family protein [Neorhizobium lilium]RWX78803.1 hypothetical protein EPK99_09465 [Neorhizobium lilium]
MKWFLILWAGPVALLISWYGLSYYDMSFGFFMLTRQTHDLVFEIYGNILGVPPEILPPLVARAIAFDSMVVLGIVLFRKRREISAWWRRRQVSGSPS